MTVPVTSMTTDETVTIASRLFGPLRVPRGSWLTFADGLLGFAGERQFAILPAARKGLFWLQDVTDGSVAFLAVDPLQFFPDYEPDLPDAPGMAEELSVVCIVTLPMDDRTDCTMNLQAPLVIDFTAKTGAQLLATGDRYHTRHAFDLKSVLSTA